MPLDRILSVNDVATESAQHAVMMIRQAPAGEVRLRILSCPLLAHRAARVLQRRWRRSCGLRWIRLHKANAELRLGIAFSARHRFPLVRSVAQDGPVRGLLHAGDSVRAINEKPVSSAAEAAMRLRQTAGELRLVLTPAAEREAYLAYWAGGDINLRGRPKAYWQRMLELREEEEERPAAAASMWSAEQRVEGAAAYGDPFPSMRSTHSEVALLEGWPVDDDKADGARGLFSNSSSPGYLSVHSSPSSSPLRIDPRRPPQQGDRRVVSQLSLRPLPRTDFSWRDWLRRKQNLPVRARIDCSEGCSAAPGVKI